MSDTTAIAITRREGLELVDPKLRTQYDQMVAEISARLSPDHAFIFSRPEQSLGGDGDQTAWFANCVGEPARVTDLPPELQEVVSRRLLQIERDVRRLANELKAAGPASADLGRLIEKALERPQGEPVWVVDDRPVLVNWGLRVAGDRAPPQTASGRVILPGIAVGRAAAASASPPPSGETAIGAGASPPTRAATPSRMLFGPLLWLLFTALLLASGHLLLRACAIAVPAWAPILHRLIPNWCRADKAGATAELRFEIDRLQNEIDTNRQALLLKAANCPGSCPVPPPPDRRVEVLPPVPTPPPEPAPSPAPEPLEEACSPVELPSTAARGELELDLKWAGDTDLDLSLVCPDGRTIFYNSRFGCGAKFDLDMNNRENKSLSPIEHIIWTDLAQAPPGRYTAVVTPYAKGATTTSRVPFDVYLTLRGRVIKHKPGVATKFSSSEKLTIFSFELPLPDNKSGSATVTEGRTPSGQTCRIGGASGAPPAGVPAPAAGPKH